MEVITCAVRTHRDVTGTMAALHDRLRMFRLMLDDCRECVQRRKLISNRKVRTGRVVDGMCLGAAIVTVVVAILLLWYR